MAWKFPDAIKELRPHFIFRILELAGGAAAAWAVHYLRKNPGYLIGAESFFGGVIATAIVVALARKMIGSQPEPAIHGTSRLPASQPTPAGMIKILENNKAMEQELSRLLDDDTNVQRAILIQYSGQKVIDCINLLWTKTNADIDLYLVDPSSALSDHQIDRIQLTLKKLQPVELRRDAKGAGVLTIYTYSTPGSVRALLVEGRVVFMSAYFYRAEHVGPNGGLALDSRGHDQPLLMVPAENQGFPLLQKAIKDMVSTWKDNGIRAQKGEFRKSDS